ncbi:hypothetical protein HUW51_11510 [Adhaeribacter swui]|uniref:Lipoprotein n=1 Tax=Adhaeribacter swui TaxID=2086471 RepID=A0A7G7G838_9BACT|nr:hypothetical protein [Adhaeribacter swui]QNF33322.1 hypothetical protein HUW51_11510 [Adhaeribacter swui]
MKRITLIKIGSFGLCFGLLSCKSTTDRYSGKQTSTAAATTAAFEKDAKPLPEQQQKATSEIAPGHCRIQGMVTAISPQPEAEATGICAQAPCRAKVKILKIVDYGQSFNQPLAVNQEINAYFKYSLKPTAQLLPNLQPALPGLKVNSIFTADVAVNEEAGNSMPWYQIELYQVE